MKRTILVSLLVALVLAQAAGATPTEKRGTYPNRIILIRHGEKGPQEPVSTGAEAEHELAEMVPEDNKDAAGWLSWFARPPPPPSGGKRKFPSGLNDKGRQRAQFLRTVFGNETAYDIGLIFAAPRDLPVETERTYATVRPLADDLGLEIDIDCAEAGAQCIAAKVAQFTRTSGQDILISWKHRELHVIATALGAVNCRKHYPDDRYDLIWTMQDNAIVDIRSMHCPGLDDARVDEGDPDCEVEPVPVPGAGAWGWDWAGMWRVWPRVGLV